MASPIAVPPGSRKTAGLIPHFSRWAASRFTCVDFPQPSEPSNVISGMVPRFCGKGESLSNTPFSPCSTCIRGGSLTHDGGGGHGFPADISGGKPAAFICGFGSRCCAMHTRGIGQNYRGTATRRRSYYFAFGCTELSPGRERNRGHEFCFLVARSRGARP